MCWLQETLHTPSGQFANVASGPKAQEIDARIAINNKLGSPGMEFHAPKRSALHLEDWNISVALPNSLG